MNYVRQKQRNGNRKFQPLDWKTKLIIALYALIGAIITLFLV